jgi:hypothetical protein
VRLVRERGVRCAAQVRERDAQPGGERGGLGAACMIRWGSWLAWEGVLRGDGVRVGVGGMPYGLRPRCP